MEQPGLFLFQLGNAVAIPACQTNKLAVFQSFANVMGNSRQISFLRIKGEAAAEIPGKQGCIPGVLIPFIIKAGTGIILNVNDGLRKKDVFFRVF
jgi:hypothetical protein